MKKRVTSTAAPDIPEKLLDLLTTTFTMKAEEVTRDATLAGDFGADDLDIIELGMDLESLFEFELTDEDELKMFDATVADVIAILESHRVKW